MKRILIIFTALLTSTTYAGGILNFNSINLSLAEPSPIPGELIVPVVQHRWSDNCIPVPYSLNVTKDPIPDPNGGPGLPLIEAEAAIHQALAAWTDIPTSYIDMQLGGSTDNSGNVGFDFVNEVSFSSEFTLLEQGVVAITSNYTLPRDTTLVGGEDIDMDGDSDVSATSTTCVDADGDGDIELPAGFYPAGTIIDSDLKFNSTTVQFVVASEGETQEEGQLAKQDIRGIATHEFGHSHGLAHSLINQISSKDGESATMWVGGERTSNVLFGIRSLHTDDIAWSSFHYPEGSAKQGPGALQIGDIPFKRRFSVISGEVRDPNGTPVLGANPYAVAQNGTIVSSSISGHGKVSVNPETVVPGELEPELQLLPPKLGIVDGRYQLPVPRGIYKLGIEAADRAPADGTHQTTIGILGEIYQQSDIPEEFWNGPLENAKERLPGSAWPVFAFQDRDNINFVTNEEVTQVLNVNEYDEQDVLLGIILPPRPPTSSIIAVRVPTQQLLDLDEGNGLLVQTALFGMAPVVSTNVPIVNAAMITTGQVFEDGTATINLQQPLVQQKQFVGQDTDLAPLYVKNPDKLGEIITHQLADTGKDIFLVVVLPEEEQPGFPGTANVQVMLDLLEPDETTFGFTYFSSDGGATFRQLQGAEAYFGLQVLPK